MTCDLRTEDTISVDVFFFKWYFCRDSEAIIPNIFFFLVLLSYERYHSKQIIGIPKIIQLCDGIMASGRKAVTHGMKVFICHNGTFQNKVDQSVFPCL